MLVPHIVRSQELTEINRRTFDVGTGSGIDLRMASKPAVTAAPAASTRRAAASILLILWPMWRKMVALATFGGLVMGGSAAGRIRDDETDRAIGVFGAREVHEAQR